MSSVLPWQFVDSDQQGVKVAPLLYICRSVASTGILISTDLCFTDCGFCYFAHLILHWNIVYGVYFIVIMEMKWKLLYMYAHTSKNA